jgi:DeoR/GlpR family transcriptional regulator of sugar metabolism
MTAKYERLNAILEILARDGKLDVAGASVELNASPATVRRDLDHLAGQRLLTRTYGGAVANNIAYDLSMRHRTARQAPEKQRIGLAAAALVAPGSIVGLSGGTTATEIARALANRDDLSGAEAVTLVTNAVNIAYELAVRPQVKVVLTGGALLSQSYQLVGPMAIGSLEPLALNQAILGVDGFDVEWGVRGDNEAEASVERLMAERAQEVIVAADSWKLGRRAFSRIITTASVHVLVTDTDAPESMTERFAQAGVRVLRV